MFAERFVGQTLGFSGNFDVLSGSPSDPLTLQVGDPNQNINVQTLLNPSYITQKWKMPPVDAVLITMT
jgi:hypothetical protein